MHALWQLFQYVAVQVANVILHSLTRILSSTKKSWRSAPDLQKKPSISKLWRCKQVAFLLQFAMLCMQLMLEIYSFLKLSCWFRFRRRTFQKDCLPFPILWEPWCKLEKAHLFGLFLSIWESSWALFQLASLSLSLQLLYLYLLCQEMSFLGDESFSSCDGHQGKKGYRKGICCWHCRATFSLCAHILKVFSDPSLTTGHVGYLRLDNGYQDNNVGRRKSRQ